MDLKGGRGKERVFGERNGESISGSSSRTASKKVMVDNYGNNVREGVKGLRFEQRGAGIETEFNEKHTRISQFPTDNWISGDEIEMNVSRRMSVFSSVEDISAHLKNFSGSVTSRESMDQFRGVERDRFDGFYASPMVRAQRGRMPTSAYPDEGPSTYKVDSFDGTSEVENLEQDRAELLRKLDELKEKLSRSYDVADKPREPVPTERSRTPPDPYGNLLTYTLSMQPCAADEQMTRSPYFNYRHGPVTFTEHHNMVMQRKNFYPPQRHPWNAIPENEDPSQRQMKRRPPHHPLQHPRPPPNEKFIGQRTEFNANPHENAFHSPACSCSGCYNPNWVAPPQVPLDDFGNRRVPKAPINLNSNHQVNPVTLLPHDYNPRRASPPPLHTRWQSYFDSEPRTAMAINRHGRIFHPVAGGAPFITCFRCFEILKLPRKLENMNKNQSKLQCGSCSTVISLEIKNKKLFTSKDSKQQSSEVGQSSNEALKGSVLSPRGSPNAGDTKSPCDDLDHSDHTLPFIDTKDNLLTEDQKLDVVKTRPTVFINGQPIPDHVVRKAEKLAGPIQPGDYWYDFRAGFWGVMGQACLSIIPPFIEEFYYPIPKNCAAGNTGVYVNGRELHQRDLDLLARRGLPTTREKFYIVEMSGRVVDEESGEDLKSLGKLAPTIEKAKRGFGMKVPKMVV